MTDPVQEPVASETDQPEQPPEQTTGEPSTDLWDAGKKALDEERRARKAAEKAVSEAAAKIKAYEDRDKSEADKQAERLKDAEDRAARATRDALRYRVAAEFGISSVGDDEDASDAELFLTASDEETMRRQAQRFAERASAAKPGTPKPDPSQGPRGPVGIDSRIAEAEKNGDYKSAIALKSQQLLKKKT